MASDERQGQSGHARLKLRPVQLVMLAARRVQFLAGARRPITPRPYRRAFHADVLPNLVSPAAPEFSDKARAMATLESELATHIANARAGGGAKAQERMKSKGKMLPRERFVSPAYLHCLAC